MVVGYGSLELNHLAKLKFYIHWTTSTFLTPSLPLATTTLLCAPMNLSTLDTFCKGGTQCMSPCDWLILYLAYVLEVQQFPPLKPNNIMLYVAHFIYPFIHQWIPGCFHLLAVVSMLLWAWVYISLWDLPLVLLDVYWKWDSNKTFFKFSISLRKWFMTLVSSG